MNLNLRSSSYLFLSFVVIACLIVLGNRSYAQCDFTPLGPSDANQASYGMGNNLSSASFGNKTYFLYQNTDELMILRFWNGSEWSTVGDGPIIPNSVSSPNLVLDQNGTPFVVYSDISSGYRISVVKWNGDAWVGVGNPGFAATDYYKVNIAIDGNGLPYVTFSNESSGNKNTVMKLNGNTWVNVGNPGISTGAVYDTRIAFDLTGTPYISYVDHGEGYNVLIKKFDGNTWVAVGGYVGLTGYTSLVCDNTGIFYVRGNDLTSTRLLVKKLEGGSWITLGGLISNSNATDATLAVDNSNIPYVSYTDQGLQSKIVVKKWDGNNWVNVGAATIGKSFSASPQISFGENNVTRLLSHEYNGLTVAYEWNGTDWIELGSRGLSQSPSRDPKTAIDRNGTPYVFYHGDSDFQGGLVQKWDGTQWLPVGGPLYENFSNQLNLEIAADGTLYAGYLRISQTSEINIKKWDGNNWALIGPSPSPTPANNYLSMALGNDSNPYVAFADRNNFRVAVRRWNGTSWETVGPNFVSTSSSSYPILRIGKDGLPVLVYNDNASGDKVIVKKWNGSNWVTVGTGPITAGPSYQTDLRLHQSGNIFFAYRDETNGQKVFVKEWNGSQWAVIGNAPLSTGAVSGVSLAIDPNGAPIVAYIDKTIDDKIAVKKWNGVSWVSFNDGGISGSYANYVSMANDSTGTPFVSYSLSDVYMQTLQPVLSNEQFAQTLDVPSGGSRVFRTDCELIGAVASSGATQVSGSVTAKVWIEADQPTGFVKRHYEITPTNNASTASGKVTLYFSQQEFDAFNTENTIKLPSGPDDLTGISNLLIEKRGGESSNGMGLPSSYTEEPINIDPDDTDIVWNSTASRWEISFSVIGFSGFFVKTASAPLPVTLISFNGSLIENAAHLTWITSSESNTNLFEIQRSADGKTFSKVGTLKAAGNSNTINRYSFVDLKFKEVLANPYYRLKMVDLDGTFAFSKIIALKGDNLVSDHTLFPNPAKKGITIMIQGAIKLKNITISDLTGMLHPAQTISDVNGQDRISTEHLTPGMYILKGETDKGMVAKRFIVN